ncbi:MAG TPA: RseA family anti-sigma factor [Pseudoxanthomonas sp.]
MTTDKIDNHYFQQLSALMDGDLPPDQARFLLRRMEHDSELTGCCERWQLYGDALRGQAHAPAPSDFAERIAIAIAAEPRQSAANSSSARARSNLAKWGGGALAASVAAVALFMVRQQVPEEKVPAAPAVASQAPASRTPAASSPDPALQAAATVTAASVAVASVPRRQNTTTRRSATRTQQTARNTAATRSPPDRGVASASVPVVHAIAGAPAGNAQRDPFSNVQINTPAARPWPRTVLPQYSSGSGAFNADYASDRAGQTFYPFEPRLQESPPVNPPEPVSQDR